MQKNEAGSTKKEIGIQTVIAISFITLVVGFICGIVFSAFKMDNSLPKMSTMTATDTSASDNALTQDEKKKIEALEKAAEAAPDSAGTWIALGNACFDSNLNEQAIKAYETALKIDPDNPDVCTDLGTSYRRNGDARKAVEFYERVQRISPGHEMSLLNAGIVYLHDLDEPEKAVAVWEQLLEINPMATTSGGMMIQNMVETLKSQQE